MLVVKWVHSLAAVWAEHLEPCSVVRLADLLAFSMVVSMVVGKGSYLAGKKADCWAVHLVVSRDGLKAASMEARLVALMAALLVVRMVAWWEKSWVVCWAGCWASQLVAMKVAGTEIL